MKQKKPVEFGKAKKKKSKNKPSKYSWLVALIAVALWGIYLLVSGTPWKDAEPLPAEPDFRVVFLDVGQADAALVLCDGESMLIVGGLPAALHACTVDKVYCPVTEYDSACFRSFVSAVNEQTDGVIVPDVGDSFYLGSARVDILACDPQAEETNNTSIVLRVVYGETSFLFTGDAETPVEQALLDSGATLSSTVLKVGHHGSSSSTSYRFLNEVMPQYAVISVGKGNSYGHPHEEVLSRLHDADVTVLRTDELGDIVLVSDGKTVEIAK